MTAKPVVPLLLLCTSCAPAPGDLGTGAYDFTFDRQVSNTCSDSEPADSYAGTHTVTVTGDSVTVTLEQYGLDIEHNRDGDVFMADTLEQAHLGDPCDTALLEIFVGEVLSETEFRWNDTFQVINAGSGCLNDDCAYEAIYDVTLVQE